ncbi:MAG: hypothetical protein EZS28_009059 [Streblomastix strix]|uniref:Uncharacterized protein n=1 Tax=Streblomastix strix TaxID=222440 RepID=A0A5J4WKM9_9EUKA|nr:MAG: hypothetical protein EZS28_009059 [Streblomastix strix]
MVYEDEIVMMIIQRQQIIEVGGGIGSEQMKDEFDEEDEFDEDGEYSDEEDDYEYSDEEDDYEYSDEEELEELDMDFE